MPRGGYAPPNLMNQQNNYQNNNQNNHGNNFGNGNNGVNQENAIALQTFAAEVDLLRPNSLPALRQIAYWIQSASMQDTPENRALVIAEAPAEDQNRIRNLIGLLDMAFEEGGDVLQEMVELIPAEEGGRRRRGRTAKKSRRGGGCTSCMGFRGGSKKRKTKKTKKSRKANRKTRSRKH